MIVRCKHRKNAPGDGGIVDGCGWQGPHQAMCPSCGSKLLRPVRTDSGQHQGTPVEDSPAPAPSASIEGEATPSNPTGTTAGNVTTPRDDPERNCVVAPGAARATSSANRSAPDLREH